MSNQYSVAEARDQFARLVRFAEKGKVVEVTRRGKTVAVILSAKEYLKQWNRKKPLWKGIEEWRKKYNVDALGLGPEIWDGVGDKSPGRDVD